MVEGLISFVFGAIKKRRATRKTAHYEHPSSLGSPPPTTTTTMTTRALPERVIMTGGGAFSHNNGHRQAARSCRFVVAPSLAEELGLWRDDDVDQRRRAPLAFPPAAAGDGRGMSGRSRRFGSMRM